MNRQRVIGRLICCVTGLVIASTCFVSVAPASEPTRAEVAETLRKACEFYSENCAKHGGYVWRYSKDLTLSEGEAATDADTIWVQPPGTPAIGEVYLNAYQTTGDPYYLDAAIETARSLVAGQLQSGGWYYAIYFSPEERAQRGYRDNSDFRPSRRRVDTRNKTVIDDDTTPSAIRFLARVDRELRFEDERIHDAVEFALDALLVAQYPNGGWMHNYNHHPTEHSIDAFPVLKAGYPESWSRQWLNDWPGVYFLNDNISGSMLETMLVAWEVYGDERYLDSARRTGEFFILAQMPEPQPAWAQQYDVSMHPCWDRKMEPPAISGLESQDTIEVLLLLYRMTGEERFLEPVPAAIDYLRRSLLPDGRLARFYELKTNRPLYVTSEYELTYDSSDTPSHYGFEFDSRLDQFQTELERLQREGPGEPRASVDDRIEQHVLRVMAAMDERGGWLEQVGLRAFPQAREGAYLSETFIENTTLLINYLRFADGLKQAPMN